MSIQRWVDIKECNSDLLLVLKFIESSKLTPRDQANTHLILNFVNSIHQMDTNKSKTNANNANNKEAVLSSETNGKIKKGKKDDKIQNDVQNNN